MQADGGASIQGDIYRGRRQVPQRIMEAADVQGSPDIDSAGRRSVDGMAVQQRPETLQEAFNLGIKSITSFQ